jgi:hypothetical protein
MRSSGSSPSRACAATEDSRVACGAGRHAARLSVMARLLIVHHTPSPATQEMFEAVLAGAMTGEITGVGVVTRPALIAAAADALNADGYLLGPHANIGYMSGALKHFFDGICYRCLTNRDGRPPIRAVRTRKQRHHRRRQGGGGHRHRAEMAARQVGCDGGRPARTPRPRRMPVGFHKSAGSCDLERWERHGREA